jgi:predicted Zn-dependent protease
MSKTLGILFTITVLFGGGYWYYHVIAGCNVPLTYRIGEVDERFEISEDEIRTAISNAESLWEDGTDRNLFTFDPEGDLVINFVYDERQERADEEAAFRETLNQKEGMSESVKEEYDRLVEEYQRLRTAYRKAMQAYENRLSAYNTEVAEWNEKGGAPEDVYERLNETKIALTKEEKRLAGLTPTLNELVRKINALGSEGNSIISDYNSLVTTYNDRFNEGGEFTQGEYQNRVINIFEFESDEELALVLGHEFGHALGIGHVEGDSSLMYTHMAAQEFKKGLSPEDHAAFLQICGTPTTAMDTLVLMRDSIKALFAAL